MDDLADIHLIDMPLDLRERSTQHGADLLREMTLIVGGRDSGTTSRDVPERLLQIATELDSVYGPFVNTVNEELEAATDRGELSVPEVIYRLPASVSTFVQHIAEVLVEVEFYCVSGKDLLLLAAPPDVAAYRSWSISEVTRQIAGEPPTPWPAYAAQRAR